MSYAQLGDRSLFSSLEAFAYLNHAAVSPLHDPALEALTQISASYASAPDIPAWFERREQTRAKLARLIDAPSPEDIGFVANTSAGNTHLALGMDWRPGQTIALMRGDFPANIIPWLQAAELFELNILWLPQIESTNRGAWLDHLKLKLAECDVTLLAISAVMFQTGWRLPLAYISELCRERGALFVVDGIQAIGALPLSVQTLHIDALTCGGHKWLMGVEGAGFVFISARMRKRLKPRMAGWLSPQESLSFLSEGRGHLRYDRPMRQDAAFVEGGTQPALGYAILDQSLDLLLELTPAAIFDHVDAYLNELERGLVALGLVSVRPSQRDARSTILSLELPPELPLKALWSALAERGILCATPDGYLRFSPHWPNPISEIPEVLRRAQDAIAQVRAA